MESSRKMHVEQYQYLRETAELLTLVAQSYGALNIGPVKCLDDLQFAIENVETIKKYALEMKNPEDVESLGLAASFSSNEEIETFERMVAFFYKKIPLREIPWSRFRLQSGHILIIESLS